MITFVAGILILILGYIFYSRFVERFAEVDGSRITPAFSMTDGVDYVPMPWWRIFLIQFLILPVWVPFSGQ